MLGFSDGSIALVYSLCILSALLCVVYGVINWNRGMNAEIDQIKELAEWEKKDTELTDET